MYTKKLFALILMIYIFTGCSEPTSHSSSEAFNGIVQGEAFILVNGLARKNTNATTIIDFADYKISCNDYHSNAQVGFHHITLMLPSEISNVGSYQVTGPLDDGAKATVNVWKQDDSDMVSNGLVLSQGAITIESINDSSVGGSAQLKSSAFEIELSGTFSVDLCQ